MIGPQGRLLAKHRKMHLFDVDIPGGIHFHESDSLTAGDQITVLAVLGIPGERGVMPSQSRPADLLRHSFSGAGAADAAAAAL